MCKQCSYYKHELARRKDERRDNEPYAEDVRHVKKSAGSKANKWCRKKIGQQHDYSVKVFKYQTSTWRAFVMACSRCHKQDFKTYTSQRLHTAKYRINGEEVEHTYWA